MVWGCVVRGGGERVIGAKDEERPLQRAGLLIEVVNIRLVSLYTPSSLFH